MITETRASATEAAAQVIQDDVVPFYASAGLPTLSITAMKAQAKGLYNRYRRLTMLNARKVKPKDFEERRDGFHENLDRVFNVAPVETEGLKPEHREQHTALEVVLQRVSVSANE